MAVEVRDRDGSELTLAQRADLAFLDDVRCKYLKLAMTGHSATSYFVEGIGKIRETTLPREMVLLRVYDTVQQLLEKNPEEARDLCRIFSKDIAEYEVLLRRGEAGRKESGA